MPRFLSRLPHDATPQERSTQERFLALAGSIQEAIKEGVCDLSTLYGYLTAENLEAQWLKGHPGFTQVKRHQKHACLINLIRHCNGKCCLELPGADHSQFWAYKGHMVMFTTQPYTWELTPEQLVFLGQQVGAMGLSMCINASESWHFPGKTVLIEIYSDAKDGVYHQWQKEKWKAESEEIRVLPDPPDSIDWDTLKL